MASALIVVDVQNDFCPGGALAVAEGDQVVGPANELIRHFEANGQPIYVSRDWHPVNHCSFKEFGGPWPPHCVVDTWGAAFREDLHVPETAHIISKATTPENDAYSDFDGTGLTEELREQGVQRVVVVGLATDYCVKATVLDALREGFGVTVVREGIRAVEVEEGDGDRAIEEMKAEGAEFAGLREVLAVVAGCCAEG